MKNEFGRNTWGRKGVNFSVFTITLYLIQRIPFQSPAILSKGALKAKPILVIQN